MLPGQVHLNIILQIKKMVYKLLLCSLLVVACVAIPQRNASNVKTRRPTGQEFVDLLPEDFNDEEYDQLLDEFVVSDVIWSEVADSSFC